MIAEIVPATAEHIAPIAYHVREADREEFWAATYSLPVDVMRRGLRVSDKAWTGLIDDVPVCMFGVASAGLLGGVGRPWMVGTDHLDRHALLFLKRCRKVVAEMVALFPILENYVDSRNVRAIMWLKWLGFKMYDAAPVGVLGIPFIRFEMRGQS